MSNVCRHAVINSFLPSAGYMRQSIVSALVQIMDCRLFGATPLPEPTLFYCQLKYWEQTAVKFESKYLFFIHENAFGNVVCKIAAISSRRRCVNVPVHGTTSLCTQSFATTVMACLDTQIVSIVEKRLWPRSEQCLKPLDHVLVSKLPLWKSVSFQSIYSRVRNYPKLGHNLYHWLG